jgi:predicted PurR-regulated permease PerM
MRSAVEDRDGTDVRRGAIGRAGFYSLILLGLYLSYLVFRPFIVALTWAVTLAIFFRGLQKALASRMGATRAAVVTTLIVGVGVMGPVALITSALVREAPQVTDRVKQTSRDVPPQLRTVWDAVRARSPVAMPEDPGEAITSGAERLVALVTPHAGAFVADFLATLGRLLAMLVALFFMLRDGDALSRQVRDRLPFPAPESERFMEDTSNLLVASVAASLITAAVGGAIGGVTFWLLGIRAPVVWGVIMAFASFVPVVGAAIVWVPAAIRLILAGEIGRGVVLLLVGTLGINLSGTILRPFLFTGRTSVNGFVIFFGVLGGAAAFGLIGLLIGPIVVVTTWRLLNDLRGV